MKRTSSKPPEDGDPPDRDPKRPAPPPQTGREPVPDPYLDAQTEKMPGPPRRKA